MQLKKETTGLNQDLGLRPSLKSNRQNLNSIVSMSIVD